MARRNKKRSNTISLPNMKDVEGRQKLVPEGEYNVTIVGVEQKEGDKAPYLLWTMEVTKGSHKGSKLTYMTSLSEMSLWNLRSLLDCLEVEIPDSEFDLDIDDVVGKELLVRVEHETYQSRLQARIVDFQSADDTGSDDDDEKSSKNLKSRDDDDEDDGKSKKPKKSSKDEDDDDDKPARGRKSSKDEDDDDDEKLSKKNKKPKKIDRDDLMDMDEDELAEFANDNELDIDLDDFPNMRKKRNAVIDAAEEAGLIAA